ncbi:MAG TPA: stage II sporulation protein M [Caulobacteraceae bacterium]|nr:stage II sporulation protein M [Caulobacteraceae bacterium]
MTAPVRDLTLKSHRFRTEREADWRELERLLRRAEGGILRKLNEDEIVNLTVLYRSALSSLSVARATSLDQGLTDYLESLCARAYFFVYGTRTTFLQRIGRFFSHDWPAAAQNLWRESLVAGGLMVLGAVVSWLLVASDADWFYAFLPGIFADGRDPSASTASLKSTIYATKADRKFLSILATGIFINNAGVSISAFALGFAFCVPTALLMLFNGLVLGSFLELFFSRGLGLGFVGWLSIHGVTELLAVGLAGAAGFRVGLAMAFPGKQTRVAAAGAAGREGAILIAGTVVMLFIAGLLEGIARQLITLDWARYVIAGTTAVFWAVYLYFPRKPRSEEARHG